MRLAMPILILVLLPGVASQAAELPEFDVRVEQLAPPGLPGGDAKMLLLSLQSQGDGRPIVDSHVQAEMNGPEQEKRLFYVDESSQIELLLQPGKWDITLKIDSIATPGKDYYFTGTFDVAEDAEQTISVYPVGSLLGLVYNEGEELVTDGRVAVSCSASYGEYTHLRTDEFGAFRYDWLPVGSCRLSASDGGRVGVTDISVVAGELTESTLLLDQEVKQNRWYLWVGFFLIVIIFYVVRSRVKSSVQPVALVEDDEQLSKRTQDILQTLPANERKVVEYLMEHPNVYQNRVIHATGVPKTTLLRLLTSLERKRVITVEKEGKVKRITLTAWFLDESEKGHK